MYTELESWLILSRAPQIGPVTAKKLLQYFENPLDIIYSSKASLSKLGFLRSVSLEYFLKHKFFDIDADLKLLAKDNVELLHLNHADYPPLLKEIYDPPIVLFTRGNISLLSLPQIGIVGSRSSDTHGDMLANIFAKELSKAGFTIVSGMALGIDAAAHKGALVGKSSTIAVLGTGLDRIYPAKNRDLAYEIAEHGLLVSEFGANTSPRTENFPRRNRIISGLSSGVLVVQAALKSGSLITARTAMEQGREVFAIPGSINNPLAKGCHHLIKQGAKLVETAEDIYTELSGMLGYSQQQLQQSLKLKGSEDEVCSDSELLKYIEFEPISIDDLVKNTGISVELINAEILLLELDNKIATVSGDKIKRL